jgi:hypothetical protein
LVAAKAEESIERVYAGGDIYSERATSSYIARTAREARRLAAY